MGALLSIPILGSLSGLATSALSGIVFFLSGSAFSALFKSCNCNSSIATRVGFAILFCINSMIAWLMRTDIATRQIEKLSWDWILMDCTGGKCYGLLATHRFCFALGLLHLILALSLIGVHDTRTKRAALQNGWWGPKILLWMVLVFITFLIPNEFFMWYGSYISPIGAACFILLGLVLLIDFAHTWSESCLDRWESSSSNLWQLILVGSTFGMYAASITLTSLLYAYFSGETCGLNTFFITFNLVLSVLLTISSVLPAVQEANPRSGLAQASMVSIYTTYLIASAVANHDDAGGACNPITNGSTGARTTTVVLGAMFTFLAIAYSTTRAATQTRALSGKKKGAGAIRLPTTDVDGVLGGEHGEVGLVTQQPGGQRKDSMRYQALLAAVEAGSLPASVLEEDDDPESEDGEHAGDRDRDDEKTGTKYSYTWFHVIFIMASMYTAGLLTDWRIVVPTGTGDGGDDPMDVYIGRSEGAMWMRVVSSWICVGLYLWSLYGPVLLPDRFGLD